MTAKIPKSVVDSFPDFPAQAAAHAVAMREWRSHMARVEEDKTKKDILPINRHWPLNPPRATEAIERAVNENDDMDYEVVDDGPSADEILGRRKNELLGAITSAEAAAVAVILPPAKARLFRIRETDIRSQDSQVVSAMIEKRRGIMSAIAEKIGAAKSISSQDIADAVNAKRTSEQQAHLADMKVRRAKIDAIERRAAQSHADVEDLTIETIDAFKIPDFTKD